MPVIDSLRRLLAFAVLSLLISMGNAVAQTPEGWKTGAYAYSANNTPLSLILEDFANSHSVDINMGTVQDTSVTGRLRSENAESFLNRLALEHRFQWFVYNNTLYVSPQSEQVSRRLKISADSAMDIKQALQGVGLLEPRFGWGELPDEGVVLVTGPPEYVKLIQDFSKESEEKPEDNSDMMVFPLKYASVADRTIKYRDQTLLVPGVATMVNELLGQNKTQSATGSSGGQGGGQADENMAAMHQESQNIMSQLIGRSMSQGHGPDKKAATLAGKVSADVRNNALLVNDNIKNRQNYQALVDSIDVPQKLIEIDAVIVDIDRNELARLSSNLGGQFGNVTGASSLLAGPSTLFVADFQNFFANIQALEGEGTASIIANPSIMTLENQPAVIDFSKTAFITATGERVVDIKEVTAGTSLRVTPRSIGKNDRSSVQLIVDIEDGKLETDEDNNASGVHNGVISTQAMVEEKRSLVMGGFHTKETGDSERRIPILGSIPWLGKLFTSTQHESSQRERLFIITPHLIGDQVDPTRYIADENRAQLNDAMRQVTERHKYTNMKDMVEVAMRDLAENRVPNGFSAGGSTLSLPALCNIPPAFHADMKRIEQYSNREVQIALGVITNNTNSSQRFDEAACRSDRTLAVAVWPKSTLQPGQSAEVFVAYEINRPARPGRISLLSESGGAPAAIPQPSPSKNSFLRVKE